ncbi:MAG: hypothetical protein IKP88_02770 [Lachnospiraceae bacterium]|nr:hypothetical protein [Lachnospiraceae bacterium]
MGRIIQKSRVLSLLKVLAVVLVLTFVSGAVPAFAETFTYETAEKGTVTISADMGDLDTDYVINAPNQKVINLAKFKSITIVNAKTYTEKVSGNTITVKNKKAKVYIDEKVKPKKITVSAKNVSIYLQKNAEVNKLIYKKANGKLNLDLKADTKVGLTLSKKSSIKITGDSSAKVDVTANVKNCIITSEVPVNVVKGKVKLETTQGTEQKPDTPSGPSDEERIKELKDSAKDNTGYSLTINHFPNKVLTTEKEVTDCIYEGCKNYTSFYLPIKDLKVLHYENYYLEKFPTLSKLVFSEVVKYSNTYYLKV